MFLKQSFCYTHAHWTHTHTRDTRVRAVYRGGSLLPRMIICCNQAPSLSFSPVIEVSGWSSWLHTTQCGLHIYIYMCMYVVCVCVYTIVEEVTSSWHIAPTDRETVVLIFYSNANTLLLFLYHFIPRQCCARCNIHTHTHNSFCTQHNINAAVVVPIRRN